MRSRSRSVAVPAAAWAVTVNAAGTVAVAALLDGTLRWYGLSHDAPLEPRVALFAHADGDALGVVHAARACSTTPIAAARTWSACT